MALAETLKTLRQLHNVTQKEVAEKTRLSVSSIVSYENGLREPNSRAMAALESYFNVSGDFLRGDFTLDKYLGEAEKSISNHRNIDSAINKFNNINTYIPTVKSAIIKDLLDVLYEFIDKNILSQSADIIDNDISSDFKALIGIINELNSCGRKEYLKRGIEMTNLSEYLKK